MKKILLLALAVLSPQVFAADIDLQCNESGSSGRYPEFIQLKEPYGDSGSAILFDVSFDKNGNAISYFEWSFPRRAFWYDTYIRLEYDYETIGLIDRETLEYTKGSYPFKTTKYDCEIVDNLDAKFKRWKKEVDDAKKARTEAKKAKNVI